MGSPVVVDAGPFQAPAESPQAALWCRYRPRKTPLHADALHLVGLLIMRGKRQRGTTKPRDELPPSHTVLTKLDAVQISTHCLHESKNGLALTHRDKGTGLTGKTWYSVSDGWEANHANARDLPSRPDFIRGHRVQYLWPH